MSISKFMKANDKYFKLIQGYNFEYVLNRIVMRKPLYDEDAITNKIAELEEYEEYKSIQKQIQDIEKELNLLSKVEVDVNALNKKFYDNEKKKILIEEEIDEINKSIKSCEKKVELYSDLINGVNFINDTMELIDCKEKQKDDLMNEYNYLSKLANEVKELDSSKTTKQQLLDRVNLQIDDLSKQIEENNYKLRDFKNYTEEKNKLESEYSDIDTIRTALSPNTGLPVLFLQIYLNRCIMTINQMLGMAYDDLEISNFVINEKEFRIPYVKKGIEVADITYASQGERSFLSLALSLALIIQTLDKYNIMLLDEVDATLDANNRRHFISILERLISMTGSEQIFLITHNNMFDNYPVDVIMTGDVNIDNFKNINIVWRG